MAGQQDPATPRGGGEPTWWDRSWAATDRWVPHVLLVASAVMSVLSPEQPPGARLVTLLVAGIAAAWIAGGHTLASAQRRASPAHSVAYLAGLLLLAAVLMSRDMIFFLFAISGFLHAGGLRPLALVFVGTGATSFLILYFTWGGLPQTAGATVAFVSVLVIQTFLIGFGVVGGDKLAELSEGRRKTVAELEAAMAKNEALQAELVLQAREAGIGQERQRMAREIHDTLAQGLIGVITQLEAAKHSEQHPEAQRRHLDNAAGLARHSLTEARRSVHALAPGPLVEHGRLPDALDHEVRAWSRLHAIPAETLVTGPVVTLPTHAEVALLRVAQEALANVAKHANASRVGVTLSVLDDQVLLDVRDDGCGFEPKAGIHQSAFGLTAMRERLAELGGALHVESQRGGGTAISASVPLRVGQATDA